MGRPTASPTLLTSPSIKVSVDRFNALPGSKLTTGARTISVPGGAELWKRHTTPSVSKYGSTSSQVWSTGRRTGNAAQEPAPSPEGRRTRNNCPELFVGFVPQSVPASLDSLSIRPVSLGSSHNPSPCPSIRPSICPGVPPRSVLESAPASLDLSCPGGLFCCSREVPIQTDYQGRVGRIGGRTEGRRDGLTTNRGTPGRIDNGLTTKRASISGQEGFHIWTPNTPAEGRRAYWNDG